jgi:hypothetical protein
MSTQPKTEIVPWRVSGSYFESCNCEAICPCRRIGGREGGRSTYGICDFALSWLIEQGHAASNDLSGLAVALVGSYDDDEAGSPWRVALYIDDRAGEHQRFALTEIFLGRAGGATAANFALAITDVYAVRSAQIEVDHSPGRWWARAGHYMEIKAARVFDAADPVACGIPGFDHPGQELVAEVMSVNESPLQWELRGRCGFATDFDYRSD